MSETVTIACKIRNGLNIGGVVVRGYFHEPGNPVPQDSIMGYAITEGFPKKVWEEWFRHNQDGEVVTNKYVMAAPNMAAMKALLLQKSTPRIRSIPYRAQPYQEVK